MEPWKPAKGANSAICCLSSNKVNRKINVYKLYYFSLKTRLKKRGLRHLFFKANLFYNKDVLVNPAWIALNL